LEVLASELEMHGAEKVQSAGHLVALILSLLACGSRSSWFQTQGKQKKHGKKNHKTTQKRANKKKTGKGCQYKSPLRGRTLLPPVGLVEPQ